MASPLFPARGRGKRKPRGGFSSPSPLAGEGGLGASPKPGEGYAVRNEEWRVPLTRFRGAALLGTTLPQGERGRRRTPAVRAVLGEQRASTSEWSLHFTRLESTATRA